MSQSYTNKPLCIDLYAGLGGWAEGFLSEGYTVIGFDIERHDYGHGGYPGQLVLQDVLTLHGSQFRDAACIVASPPCQRYSHMAMPFSRGKREASWQRWHRDSPFSEGFHLNDLFDACFRIQREACAAAGRYIPLVVENVKGAQPWVGRAKAHFGSYYLWGDVESVGSRIVRSGRLEFGIAGLRVRGRQAKVPGLDNGCFPGGGLAQGYIDRQRDALKVPGFNFHQHENGGPGGSFQSAAVAQGLKVPGINWSDRSKPARGFNVAAAQRYHEGVKIGGSGDAYWREPLQAKRREATAIKNCSLQRRASSKSNSRKAASAMIAKIPPELARHVARMFKP